MKEDDQGKWPKLELGELTMIFDVKHMAKSVDFYTRLGFERTVVRSHDGEGPTSSEDNPNWATFRCGHQSVHLMLIGTDMMHFVVADPKAVMASLKERGLDPIPAGPGDSGTSLADPDGNIIYIMKSTPRD